MYGGTDEISEEVGCPEGGSAFLPREAHDDATLPRGNTRFNVLPVDLEAQIEEPAIVDDHADFDGG